MTGYGRKTFSINGKIVIAEIKTLNSKTFDLNLRLSPLFREQEMEIRDILNKKILRGKTDCTIGFELNDEKNGELNLGVVKDYYRQLSDISNALGEKDAKIFELIFRLPNLTQQTLDKLGEADCRTLMESVEDVCGQIVRFRKDEGVNLENDLMLHIHMILSALGDVEEMDPARVERQRNKLYNDIHNLKTEEQPDMNRFEQELIYYLEKMDITEEVIRLKSHCSYFTETLNEPTFEKGKKLGFISQEMNREINTIGSKAYDADIQRKVVVMKDELEKIKEQLNNVL